MTTNIKPQSKATKSQRVRDIENKKFYCIDCYNNCSLLEKKYYVKIDNTCAMKIKFY